MTLTLLFAVFSAALAAPPLHPILQPEFQKELNALTNSVLAYSDRIDLLVDGRESYPERWRMLENAKKSIHFSTMYIFRDDTTKKLGDLLIRKRNEGVDVKIIVYGVYSLGNLSFYRRMRDNGVEVKMYSSVPEVLLKGPLRFWRRHLHDKYLVVDGQEAITGGMNWSSRYERGGTNAKVAWRDTDLLVSGPQARIVEQEFQKRWNRDEAPDAFEKAASALEESHKLMLYPAEQDYSKCIVPDPEAPMGYRVRGLTRFLYQQPFEDRAVYMTNFYKAMIGEARSHIWWQSISARPAEGLRKCLMEAAARGVDVRLMTNSKRNMCMLPIGGWPLYYITQAEYEKLIKGGIRIFEYSGSAPMHAKGFIVDDVVAAVGSYNATFTAEKYYTESGFAVYDTEGIREVRKMFENDFAQCKEVTLESLHRERPNPLVTGVVQTGASR
jgi:cardiolipin synthase